MTDLFNSKEYDIKRKFPSTRYQGSKKKLVGQIIKIQTLKLF